MIQEQINNTQEPVVVYGGEQNQTRTRGKAVAWQKLDALVKIFM